MPVNYGLIRLAGLSERMAGWAEMIADAAPPATLDRMTPIEREKYESERRKAKAMLAAAEEFTAWEQATSIPEGERANPTTRRLHGRGERKHSKAAHYRGALGKKGKCLTPGCPRANWRGGQCAQCYESAKMIHAARMEREKRMRGVA